MSALHTPSQVPTLHLTIEAPIFSPNFPGNPRTTFLHFVVSARSYQSVFSQAKVLVKPWCHVYSFCLAHLSSQPSYISSQLSTTLLIVIQVIFGPNLM